MCPMSCAGFLHEHVDGLVVVLEAAGDVGVVLVEGGLVLRRVVDARDAALRECGIAETQLPLGEQEDLRVRRQVDGCIQTGSTCAGDDDIIVHGIVISFS